MEEKFDDKCCGNLGIPHELSYFSEYVPFVRFCSGPVTPAENRLRFLSWSGKLVDGQVS